MPRAPGRLRRLVRHRATRLAVAFTAGLAVSLWALERATMPESAEQRAMEEAMVRAARGWLGDYVAARGAALEIVDPLAPRRAIGKSYVYPSGKGFEVSGYYRRGDTDTWHPFLMTLGRDGTLETLAVRDDDPSLRRRSEKDPKLRVEAR